MTFEYQQVRTAMAQIDIDDIGNCCLISRNLIGEEKYLYINTQIGSTQIITYGPIVPDFDELPADVKYTYARFDFSETKIIKTIERFISDADQVEETCIEDIYPCIRPMIDNMISYE